MSAVAPSGPSFARVIAVDWSGARQGAERRIWLCEVAGGGVVRLESGRSREALVAELGRMAGEDTPFAVGLDFAFSMPSWVFARTGFDAAPELWALAARRGDRWLAGPRWPFWRTRRPGDLPGEWRHTERETAAQAPGGRRPSSVFKLVGADQVGAGSVRGMALLPRLQQAGVAVWPFDDARAGAPVAVEIWPRLCYEAPLAKSRGEARVGYLARHHPTLDGDVRRAAERSDDALDALVAAWAMWRHREALSTLPPARDPTERREGRIWAPPTAGRHGPSGR